MAGLATSAVNELTRLSIFSPAPRIRRSITDRPRNESLVTLMVAGLLLCSACGRREQPQPEGDRKANTPAAQASAPETNLRALLQAGFGSSVQLATRYKPHYLKGDFNGDGAEDLVAVMDVAASKDILPREVVVLRPWAAAAESDRRVTPPGLGGRRLVALAILHGSSQGWNQPSARYLLVDDREPSLFETPIWQTPSEPLLRVVPRGTHEQGIRLPPQGAKGDCIFQATESSGGLIYWDGTAYRWYENPED